MGTMVPIELVRLRSATTMDMEILRDSLPQVEALAQRDDLRMAPLAELHEAIRSAVDMPNLPGTPAAIRTALAVLLGETNPPDRPPRTRSVRGSVLPHRGASPPMETDRVGEVTSSQRTGAASKTIAHPEMRR
jgi:hypothetical protein